MTLQEKFNESHAKNPEIYELFKKYTFEVMGKGFKNFGAHTILHRIRWYSDVESNGEEFKINNNYSAYYSRLFMKDFPEHEGFFRTRTVGTEMPEDHVDTL